MCCFSRSVETVAEAEAAIGRLLEMGLIRQVPDVPWRSRGPRPGHSYELAT